MIYSDNFRNVYRIGSSVGRAYDRYGLEIIGNEGDQEPFSSRIAFQHDTIPNVGVVGWTNECLLAIVLDRLRAFQAGDFPSWYNDIAIKAIEAGLGSLESRTLDREQRGVEGQHAL